MIEWFFGNDKVGKISISPWFAYRIIFKTAAKDEMVSAVYRSAE